jgi:hypothetical protein
VIFRTVGRTFGSDVVVERRDANVDAVGDLDDNSVRVPFRRDSDSRARCCMASSTLATSTIDRTRSWMDMESCRRTWLMSTPRLSSITGSGSSGP